MCYFPMLCPKYEILPRWYTGNICYPAVCLIKTDQPASAWMKYIDITARALAESQKNVKLQENNTNGTPFRSHCERSANSMQKLDAANCSPGSAEHVDSILVVYNLKLRSGHRLKVSWSFLHLFFINFTFTISYPS